MYTLMDDATNTLTGFPKVGNRSVGGGNQGDPVRITALGYLERSEKMSPQARSAKQGRAGSSRSCGRYYLAGHSFRTLLDINQTDPLKGTFTIKVTLDGNEVTEFDFIMDDFDTDEGYPSFVNYYLTALISYRLDDWNGGGMIQFNNGAFGVSSNYKPAAGGAGTIDVKGVQGAGVGSTLVINQCVIEYLWSPP